MFKSYSYFIFHISWKPELAAAAACICLEGGAQVLRRAARFKVCDPTGRRGNWALHMN